MRDYSYSSIRFVRNDDGILFISGVIISRKYNVLIGYSGTRERRAPPPLNSSVP